MECARAPVALPRAKCAPSSRRRYRQFLPLSSAVPSVLRAGYVRDRTTEMIH
jgi:hypothetical protein